MNFTLFLINLFQLNYPTHFFIIKPNICANFTNLFWHETLHVSDSSFVQHREFIDIAFEQDQDGPAHKLSKNLYDIYHCWVYSE